MYYIFYRRGFSLAASRDDGDGERNKMVMYKTSEMRSWDKDERWPAYYLASFVKEGNNVTFTPQNRGVTGLAIAAWHHLWKASLIL